MDEIFANAKSILLVWIDDIDPENVPQFQDTLQLKSKQAQIACENVRILFKSRRATSSFDLILFDLLNKKDTPTNIELLNEFFRLLRPNGYLITHIKQQQQIQAIGHFKMCGFSTCNPLDSNSSFLIENKNEDMKRMGSLWLCQKPAFDVGYSVPIRRTGVNLIRQISSTGGGKKTWRLEHDDDDDDMIDTAEHFVGENDRKKPDAKNDDRGTISFGIQRVPKNLTRGLAQVLDQEEDEASQENIKSTCGNCNMANGFRCAACRARGLPAYKPSDRVTVPKMSDV